METAARHWGWYAGLAVLRHLEGKRSHRICWRRNHARKFEVIVDGNQNTKAKVVASD